MRDFLKSKVGWLGLLAFLTLPNCVLDSTGLGGGVTTHFNPGSQPHSSAIFCDIESSETAPHCATPEEVAMGVPLAQAAVALVKEQSSTIALDYSPAVISAHGCSPGQPVAITFVSPFPDGTPVCLNCGGVIGPVYASVNAACAARCEDVAGSAAFCGDTAHAHAATNTSGCVDGACTDEGSIKGSFVDPRRTLEPVDWVNRVGTGVSGPDSNTLARTSATSVPSAFDAGAASSQTVTHGDGYVEYTVAETDRTRGLGFASGAGPDGDPSLSDVDFAISLSSDGHVFVVENGTPVTGPNPDLSFATYAAGDRMRVTLTDKHNGTAEVRYFLIPASCAGAGCDGMLLHTSDEVGTYPLRVDASLREQGATLADVRLVRIK